MDGVDHEYFSVKHKPSLKSETSLWASKGILWLRDFVLDEIDAIALFCDGMLVDYLAWVKMASVGMELYTILLSLQVCGVATRTMSRQ